MASDSQGIQHANTVNTRHELGWYQVDASVVDSLARRLLTEYAKIPADQIDEKVTTIREKAFKIFPYPCIGMYRFLDLSMHTQPYYTSVLERVKGGECLLDIGCAFGQELRQLVFDGAPAENLFGADLRFEFIELGYELFGDKSKSGIKLLTANVFDDDSLLAELYCKMGIVYAGSFFHLFDWAQQFEVAKRVVKLLKPEKGSTLLGRQVANVEAGDYTEAGYSGERPRYRHNEKSWSDFWDEVGEATNSQWQVDVKMIEFGGKDSGSKSVSDIERKLTEQRREGGARMMRFVVTRL